MTIRRMEHVGIVVDPPRAPTGVGGAEGVIIEPAERIG
jgi:hypothetical protein